MPADLVDRIKFRITLRDLEVEVARLSAAEDRPVLAARGEEQSRTITFDSESLTIMIRVDANADGTARIDGWLAPPQDRTIEMKTPAGSPWPSPTSRDVLPSARCRAGAPSWWCGPPGRPAAPAGPW